MAEPGWLRHAIQVGVFEFRRSVRAIWRDKARFGLMALGLVFPSVILVGFTVLFADAIRGAGTISLPEQVSGMVALFWLFGVFIIAQRVASARPRIDAEPLMLTTVSSRTAAGGLLVAETLRVLAYLGLPALTLTGVVLYLFGPSVSLVSLPLAAVLFAATAVVGGSVVGYAVAWLVATSRFVARHKTVLGSAVALLAMGGYALTLLPQTGFGGQAALAWLPVGWFADLAALGTPITGARSRVVGALLGSVVILVGGGIVVERVTAALWFTDPVSVDDDAVGEPEARSTDSDEQPSPRRDALAAAIRPLSVPGAVAAPTRHVAEWALLRTRRDPRRLMFLLMPVVLFGSSFISTGVQSGSLRTLAAPLCAVALPWMAGVLVAMNPFGDEGAVLPITLTTVSGTQYVRGLILPCLIFGLPVVVVVTAGAALFSPDGLVPSLVLVFLSVYLTVVAAAIAPAIGMRFPRFSAISIGQSRAVLPPRITAVVLHLGLTVLPGSILVLVVVAPELARALIAGLFGSLPATLLGLVGGSSGALSQAATWFNQLGQVIRATDVGQFRLVGGGILLIGGVVVAFGSYRYAIQRFKRFDPS
jgi:hypothetical protein